jgi:soluble lytic murein transglycosylase-like protein
MTFKILPIFSSLLLTTLFSFTSTQASAEAVVSTNPEILSEKSILLPELTFETALKSLSSSISDTTQIASVLKKDDTAWLPPTQRALAAHLVNTYDVSPALASNVIASVFHSGRFYNIDPLLLLAVMKVESTFNPRAVSSAKAKGLMQVLPKAHPEKIALIGGVDKLYIPHLNVKMGAQILRDCVDRAGGVIARGLQFYNGAGNDPTQKYANKVLTAHQEFSKIKLAMATDNNQIK